METIIGAIVSAAAAITVCIINANNQNKKILAEMDKQNALQAQRLKQLEEKVNRHNNLIERTYAIEQKLAVLDNSERVSEHRIDDLEDR